MFLNKQPNEALGCMQGSISRDPSFYAYEHMNSILPLQHKYTSMLKNYFTNNNSNYSQELYSLINYRICQFSIRVWKLNLRVSILKTVLFLCLRQSEILEYLDKENMTICYCLMAKGIKNIFNIGSCFSE